MNAKQYMNLPTQSRERSPIAKRKIFSILMADYRNLKGNIRVVSISKLKEDKSTVIHLLIPSEVFGKKLMYDCVIRFLNGDEKIAADTDMQVFSNSPSFMFTFAYLYNKENVLVDFMLPKIGELAKTQPPLRTNPRKILGAEKSIVFALEYIREKNLISVVTKPKLVSEINKVVPSCEDKFKEYNSVKKEFKEEYANYKKTAYSFSFN